MGVDADSVRTEGTRRTFSYVSVTQEAVLRWPIPAHDYSVISEVIDCEANARSIASVSYYMIGARRPIRTGDRPTPFLEFDLDTTTGDIRNLVCDAGLVADANGRGVRSAERFAMDRRSGRLPADAEWLAKDWD